MMANKPLQSIKFPGLSDTYTTPQVDATLTTTGAAADAKKVGDEITSVKQDLSEKGFSEDAKVALLNCFSHVAWTDEHGQDYYDALHDALYPETNLSYITADFDSGQHDIYENNTLNDLKAYLTVTGYYSDGTTKRITSYALSGTLAEGTSVITVTYNEKTTTFSVTVLSALDSIAFGELTYRDIFITNNLFALSDFESISSLPETETTLSNGDKYYASYGTPKPNITTEAAYTGDQSLKVASTSSAQMKYTTTRLPNIGKLLLALGIKVDRYVSGNCGIQINVHGGESSASVSTVRTATLAQTATTDGFVQKTMIVQSYDVSSYTYKDVVAFVGSMNTGNADFYVDDVIMTVVPDDMTSEQAAELYSNYIGMIA